MDNLIVCPEPPAAKVGRDVFAKGGNAVDAAVAAAFAQAVANPLQCGIGGTALVYYYDAQNQERIAFNAEATIGSRPVPDDWAEEYVGRSGTTGRHIIRGDANQRGYQSIMTPGFVRGCWTVFRRFGSRRISWSDLLSPAIRLAADGFEIYPYIAGLWRKPKGKPGYPGLLTKLHATSDAARIYLRSDGSVYEVGDRLLQPELARTIRLLADKEGEDFYAGEIAGAISQDLTRHGAFITPEDLRYYRVHEDQPWCGRYRGLEVTAPPFSFGPHFIEMLQIAEHFDLRGLGHNTPEYIDTLARIQRASFADNMETEGRSLKEARLLERKVISLERASEWVRRVTGGDRIVISGSAVQHGTTHLTCVDADRNVVSFTHSIGSLAGSGVITPELGFIYNNFLGFFSPLPGFPDSILPGKRIGGSMSTIIFNDGKPYLVLGSPGSRSSTSTMQCVVNAVDQGMDMRTAVSVPRMHSDEQQIIYLEPHYSERTAQALRAMGNTVRRSTDMACVQAILVRSDTGELEAGPDPRGDAGVGRYP